MTIDSESFRRADEAMRRLRIHVKVADPINTDSRQRLIAESVVEQLRTGKEPEVSPEVRAAVAERRAIFDDLTLAEVEAIDPKHQCEYGQRLADTRRTRFYVKRDRLHVALFGVACLVAGGIVDRTLVWVAS